MSESSSGHIRHRWRFFRAGGFDQVRLDSGADLQSLGKLDQKLWMALSCPTRGLEFDDKTLDLIDSDQDGRIRAPEILAATRWACGLLKDSASLLKSSDALPLDAINEGAPEGKQLLSSARQILENLGKKDAGTISVEDTNDTVRIFAQTNFNGDGVIPPDAASDEYSRSVICDILTCLGGQPDRSGKTGISQALLEQFFAEAKAYSDWWAKAEHDAPVILPLGPETAQAFETFKAVRAKVDDYFARCRLAGFDERALPALNRHESEYTPIAAKDLTLSAGEVSGFPLTRVEAGRPLPLKEGLNPAWAEVIGRFNTQVVTPLLGPKTALTDSDWAAITTRFAPYEAWMAGKAGLAVERLGLARVRDVLAGPAHDALTALVERDKALEPEANAIAAVDKLVRFHRDLYKLLNNFVSFRDFYARRDKAIFQAGTLYLDQRSCDLCVWVQDVAKHATMAYLSQTCLVYCEVVRRTGQEKGLIAAAFTAGDSDNLMLGRNGIFYDRKGRDWDATIVKILDSPISIGQAFWSPYKQLSKWIGQQIAKRSAAATTMARDKMVVNAVATATAKPGEVVRPPEPKKLDIGVVAAIGVAVGGIAAAMGALLNAFFGLGMWMPLGLVALILLISCPSMIIAWFKLRHRNLGPILDANGWAVNSKARINIPFGRSLTGLAKLPPGARRDFRDPYAQKMSVRAKAAACLVVVFFLAGTWHFGLFETILPNLFPKSSWVKNREAAKQHQDKALDQESLPSARTP